MKQDNQEKKNAFAWTVEQQCMLNLAKKGNRTAARNLFNSMSAVLEQVHRYSQDGLYPVRFGYGFNYGGRRFDEASGDIYGMFLRAVEKFDARMNIPFGAYLVGELRHRAMDWTRNRRKDRLVLVGQQVPADSQNPNGAARIFSEVEFSEACNSFYAERAQDNLFDEDTHPVEYQEIRDLILKIRQEVDDCGEKKLQEFVDLFLIHADNKKVMETVAEAMGVSRACAYIYLGKLRQLIVPKLGMAA